MNISPAQAWEDCAKVRALSPLVHNITNFVVMNVTANALLAAGASPIMAHAEQEVEDIVTICQALVLNIGTLEPAWVSAMITAGRAANAKGIPILLDPVGAGASAYRTRTALGLLHDLKPAILRGNASEIMALAGQDARSRGVDSGHSATAAQDAALLLAERYTCVVVVSGESDLVVSPGRASDQTPQAVLVHGGHALMPRITGMGCSASALVAAYAAVASTPFAGAISGMAAMAAAGARAGLSAGGPASFQTLFLDAMYNLTQEDFTRHVRLEALPLEGHSK